MGAATIRALTTAALVALLGGCLGGPPPASSEAPSTTSAVGDARGPMLDPGAWQERAPIPVDRVEIACATDGRTIHAVGGFDSTDAPTNLHHVYDVAADAWTLAVPLPVPIHHTGLVHHGGAYYVFGGYTGPYPFVASSAVFRLDPAAGAWVSQTTLPRPRGGHATVLRGDEVFLVGGADADPPGTHHAPVDAYNLTTGTWRAGPPTPRPRDHLAGAMAGGEIVVAGGRRFTLDSNTDDAETLAEERDGWATLAPLPSARGGLASAAWHDLAIFLGGESTGGTFDDVDAFFVANRTWLSLPPLPQAVHAPCAVVVGDDLHVIAGGPQPAFTASNVHRVLGLAVGR